MTNENASMKTNLLAAIACFSVSLSCLGAGHNVQQDKHGGVTAESFGPRSNLVRAEAFEQVRSNPANLQSPKERAGMLRAFCSGET